MINYENEIIAGKVKYENRYTKHPKRFFHKMD